MLKSFRDRIILSYIVVAITAALAVGIVALAIIGAYNTRGERDYLRANAVRIASDVVPLLQPPPDANPDRAPNEMRERLATAARLYSFLGQVRVEILDPQQRVLVDSGAPAASSSVAFFPPRAPANSSQEQVAVDVVILPDRQPGQSNPEPPPTGDNARQPSVVDVAPAPSGGFSFGEIAPAARERSRETFVAPVLVPNTERVAGYVRLSQGPAYGIELLAGVRWALLGGVLAGAVLAVVAGVATGRQAARPLEALGRAAERMAAGDLKARAQLPGDDEFARLAAQFDHMAGQVEAGFAALAADREALRRFVADAAHELRTPLTAAMTFVELVQDSLDPSNVKQIEFLRAAYGQLERLGRMVRQLLDLSLLDAGAARVVPVAGDLRALAERALAGIMPIALERGLNVASALPAEPIAARFDEQFLRQALDNLLSNALKFTPAGGTVTLGTRAENGSVRLWVEDTGPGIPAGDLPHVFERFYRGQGAARAEGSGLGLAIAQAIAQAHGGTLSAENIPGAGARFTLALPGPA